MSTISDAVDSAVGDITATARTAAQDVADAVTAFYSTELAELQAVATSAQTQVTQLTSALAAATSADAADQAQVDALTEQLATANQQLAQVQADFAAYKKSHPDGPPPPPPPPPVGRFPGDPGPTKILWGQTREGGVAAVAARAQQYATIVGAPKPVYPKAFHRYMTPTQATVAGAQAAVTDAATIQGWGAYPLIDVKEPGSMSFAQVGAGGMDDIFDTVLAGLIKLGKPAAVSFHNEPVGDGKGAAADYAAALARLQARRDAAGGKSLITITGALGIGSFSGFGGSNGDPKPWLQAIAPYVDVWNTHRYLQATDKSAASTWKSVPDTFGPFWDLEDAIDAKRAKFHGEWGIHTRASDPAFAPAWMDAFMAYGISRGLALATFFDSGQNSANDWTLDLGGEKSRLNKMAQQLAAIS